MLTQKQVQELKAKGELILTQATFRKRVIIHDDPPQYEYKGKRYYYADWILTYGRKQYMRLHNNHEEVPWYARLVQAKGGDSA